MELLGRDIETEFIDGRKFVVMHKYVNRAWFLVDESRDGVDYQNAQEIYNYRKKYYPKEQVFIVEIPKELLNE